MPLPGRFQFLQRCFQLPLLRHDDVDQAIHADPSLVHVLFELLDGVHADSLSNRNSASCAVFGNFYEEGENSFGSRELTTATVGLRPSTYVRNTSGQAA